MNWTEAAPGRGCGHSEPEEGSTMKRSSAVLALLVLLATAVQAAEPAMERPLLHRGSGGIIHGGAAGGQAKAAVDSFLLMGPSGSGAPFIGDFELGSKTLDPGLAHGWTSTDNTQPTEVFWEVGDYLGQGPLNGSWWVWCGDRNLPSCDGGISDPDGGYGNNWDQMLEWRQVVTDYTLPTTLGITATANVDCEPGYDRTALQAEKNDIGFVDVNIWDGRQALLAISETVTYQPGEYMGPGGDEVVLVWHMESDGGWSDEDCSYPSSGAFKLDDVTITSSNGPGTGGLVDFEDQTFGPFAPRLPLGVGDFAKIWTGLFGLDPCRANLSRQVAFIDDGVVVPGTGGSYCQTWCYGPGGYIVNTSGGLAGEGHYLNNFIESPAMPWPDAAHDGAVLAFDVYRHEDLDFDSPGIFYDWGFGTHSPWDPEGWYNFGDGFAQYGPLGYLRYNEVVDDLIGTQATHVKVRLRVFELAWIWGPTGDDGYPAPYFDNVRLTTYDRVGPSLATRELDLAQDNFPESGTLDTTDPGSLWVRFDMARNISPPTHLRRDPGDSVVFDCVVNDHDAVLEGPPEIVYEVRTNASFDPYRTDPTPYTGRLACGQVTSPTGGVVPDRFFADLPDTGWLFPGDVVHYYIEATQIDTLTSVVETSVLPADLTGFGDHGNMMGYDPSFTVRCLPNIDLDQQTQPSILLWNDFGDRGGMDEWFHALLYHGWFDGYNLDQYYTNAPSSGVGNGLGGRATAAQLAGYSTLLYTAGDLASFTISNGDLEGDSSPDLALLTSWLDSGGRHAFLTGDNLVSDLVQAGPAGTDFVTDMMQVGHDSSWLRDLIGGQYSPTVRPTSVNPVFSSVTSWVAYGGCQIMNTFDAVTALTAGERIAVFTDETGADGGYPYSAATLAEGVGVAGTSEVISLPYDLMFVHTDPDEGLKADATAAARTRLLGDVLARFGEWTMGDPAGAGEALPSRLAATNYPNPFNPITTIRYTAPRDGELTLRVFNLRGELVRTLINGRVEQGAGSMDWNGRDDRGSRVASGVYFYEVRMGGEAQVGKMALVK